MLEVRNAISGILDHYTLEDFAMSAVAPSGKKERRKNPKVGKKNHAR